jgi:hypothetical protein
LERFEEGTKALILAAALTYATVADHGVTGHSLTIFDKMVWTEA